VLAETRGRRRLVANKGWREQARQEARELLGEEPRKPFCNVRGVPWRGVRDSGVEVFDKLTTVLVAGMDDASKRKAVEETVRARGEVELRLFTDGSVEEGVCQGGAACVGVWRGEEVVVRKAAGRWCSSYCAELVAMQEAVGVIERLLPESVLVCTDSQALLRMLLKDDVTRNAAVCELRERLVQVSVGRRVVLQWVPAHVGVEGNEWADGEAKRARGESQEGAELWFECVKSRLKRGVVYEPGLEGRVARVYRGDC